jgi:predicted nucleic acid-binding protein
MRRILVDLNVVLDVLLDRKPQVEHAAALWRAIEEQRIEGLLSAHGFTTIFYLVAKRHGRDGARRVVADLLTVFAVAPVDEDVLRRAGALDLADFEDAVGAAAAEAMGCRAIVTRDPAGYAGGPLDAVEPALALAMLEDEVREPGMLYGRRRSASARRRAQR